MGSFNKIHGLTVIAPTQPELPEECFLQWWYAVLKYLSRLETSIVETYAIER
jgi:hypothetical protein